MEISESRAALSYEALLIDTAAGTVPGSHFSINISGIPAEKGRSLSSKAHPAMREPLFHDISISQEGELYAQKNPAEPV